MLGPSRRVTVTVELASEHVAEFDAFMRELHEGKLDRTRAVSAEIATVTDRAMKALVLIQSAIEQHGATGQAKRLVRFLAGVYNGQDYPFPLHELRALDHALGLACLDYLAFDRLGIREIHHLLDGGEAWLIGKLEQHGMTPLPL
jgi:hypothetical protein